MARVKSIPQQNINKSPKLTKKNAIIIAAVACVLAAIIAVVSILSFVAADGYKVKVYDHTETGVRQITSVDLYANVTEGGRFRIDEIWVQLADIQGASVDVYVSRGTDTDEQATGASTKLLKKVTITKSQIAKDGWVKIYKGDGFPIKSRPQIKIGFDTGVTLQEVVMIDTNQKQPILKATGASIGEAPTESGTAWSKIDSVKAGSDNELVKDLAKIIDAQDTCPYLTFKA